MNSDVSLLFKHHHRSTLREWGRSENGRLTLQLLLWVSLIVIAGHNLWAQIPPPTLSVHRLSSEQLELRLTGQNLSSFSIERSLDLRTWQAIASPPEDTPAFTLPIMADLGQQFFRAVSDEQVSLPPVVPVLDSARASTAWIMPSGGVVEAQAADGTSFRLEIPENALLSPQQVTLTPVVSVDNLPFTAGYHGGVDLQPYGLRLLQPAVLEIVTAGNFEAASLVGFSYRENGGNLHLIPSSRSAGQVNLFFNSFAGYGVASAEAGERGALQTPSCASERALRQISLILDDLARRQAEQGAGAEFTVGEIAELRSILAGWHAGSVLPGAAQAQDNEWLVRSAAREYAEWHGWVLRLLGDEDAFQGEIEDTSALLGSGYMNALDRSEERCATGDKWIETARMLAYAGEYIHLFNPGETGAASVLNQVERCSSLELFFESQFYQDFSSENAVRYETVVQAERVPLQLDLDFFPGFSGQGPLEYTYFHHDVLDCAPGEPGGWLEASWTVTDSTLRVLRVYPEINLIISQERAEQAGFCAPMPDLEQVEASPMIILLDPGTPRETIEWRCFDSEGAFHSSGTDELATIWKDFFNAAHRDEHLRTRLDKWDDPAQVEDAFLIVVSDVSGSAEIIAEKSYERVWHFLENPVLEETRLIIRQAPAQ